MHAFKVPALQLLGCNSIKVTVLRRQAIYMQTILAS